MEVRLEKKKKKTLKKSPMAKIKHKLTPIPQLGHLNHRSRCQPSPCWREDAATQREMGSEPSLPTGHQAFHDI